MNQSTRKEAEKSASDITIFRRGRRRAKGRGRRRREEERDGV